MTAAARTKCLVWGESGEAALQAWLTRAAALGIDTTHTPPNAKQAVHSDAAAIRAGLARATACQCRHDVDGAEAPAPTNPLKAMREAAGLSQSQAAAAMGISKRAVQLAEGRAVAPEAMVARAAKAFRKGGG